MVTEGRRRAVTCGDEEQKTGGNVDRGQKAGGNGW